MTEAVRYNTESCPQSSPNHLLRFMSGRNVASNPKTAPTETNAHAVNTQLLSRHHVRTDQVKETSGAYRKVDVKTESPKTSVAAMSPAVRPTTSPFLRFGYMTSLAVELLLHLANRRNQRLAPFRPGHVMAHDRLKCCR